MKMLHFLLLVFNSNLKHASPMKHMYSPDGPWTPQLLSLLATERIMETWVILKLQNLRILNCKDGIRDHGVRSWSSPELGGNT